MTPEGEDIAWTSADGLSLYAKSYGPAGAPLTVLCIHGLTRNHKDFEPVHRRPTCRRKATQHRR